MKQIVVAAAVCLLVVAPRSVDAAPQLALPFSVPAAPSGKGKACKDEAPQPVISLKVGSRYDQTDATKSTIDEDADAAYAAGMEPLREFAEAATANATRYFESGATKADKASCVLDFLDAWASADALSDLGTRQSLLSTTRIVAGAAMAYAIVKPSPYGTVEQRERIDAWFLRLSDRIRPGYSLTGDKRLSDRQNHRYWAGFAVAALGVATGDRSAVEWGVESYRIGVCQIRDDGVLPLELARGKRARDYHLHATAPLVMIAELATANGIEAYDLCGGAIHRLVAFDLTAIADPSAIEALAGERQLALPMRDGMVRGDRVAWLAPYFTRFPEAEADADLALPARMTSSNLGGNLAAYYGYVPSTGD